MRSEFAAPARSRWVHQRAPSPAATVSHSVDVSNERTRIAPTAGSQAAPAIKVARAQLAKYVGSYEIREEDEVTSAVVSLSGDTLFLDLDRTGPVGLVPISDTNFSESGKVIQFVPDGHGTIAAFLLQTVEGEQRAVRVR